MGVHRQDSSDPPPREWIERVRLLAGMALAIGAVAGPLLVPGGRTPGGMALATLAALGAGICWIRLNSAPPHSGSPLLTERGPFLILILIFLVGGAIRLHRIGDVEGRHCYSHDSTIDEALKGQWAMEFLHGTRSYTPFIRHWGERETLYIYLESAAIFLFGRSILTLRAVSVGCGLFTLALLFLLARRLFGNRVALSAAALLALSAWHISTNRISERFNMVPLATCLAIWLLARADRKSVV